MVTINLAHLFCVYMHSCGNEVIYVGSGPYSRAFTVGLLQRGKTWFDAVAGRPVTVTILSTHETRDEAYLAEFAHIHGLQPVANGVGKGRQLDAKSLPRGRPRKRGPGIGAWVYCSTIDRRFATMREASEVTGIPLTSVSRAMHSGKPARHFGQDWFFKLV